MSALHDNARTITTIRTCCTMLCDLANVPRTSPKQMLGEALNDHTLATAIINQATVPTLDQLRLFANWCNHRAEGSILLPIQAEGLRNGQAFTKRTSSLGVCLKSAAALAPQVIQPRRLLLLLLQSLNNNISDVCDLFDLQRRFLLTGLELSQNQQTAISTLGITREQACQVITAEEETQLRNILNPQPQPKVKKPKEKRAEEMTSCNYLCLQYLARVVNKISLGTVCETLQLPKNEHYKWKESCPLRLAKFFKVLPEELNRILTDDEKIALDATLPKNAATPEPPPPAPPAAMAAPEPTETATAVSTTRLFLPVEDAPALSTATVELSPSEPEIAAPAATAPSPLLPLEEEDKTKAVPPAETAPVQQPAKPRTTKRVYRKQSVTCDPLRLELARLRLGFTVTRLTAHFGVTRTCYDHWLMGHPVGHGKLQFLEIQIAQADQPLTADEWAEFLTLEQRHPHLKRQMKNGKAMAIARAAYSADATSAEESTAPDAVVDELVTLMSSKRWQLVQQAGALLEKLTPREHFLALAWLTYR